MIMATLPHEILDHILDYLHDDPRTLGLCALASRVLLQTSRYHRFNGLHIGLHNIRIIMPLLNASPDLAQTITSLTMSSASRSPVSHEILSTLQSLPALTKISLWIHRLPVTAYLGHLTSLCLMGNRDFWCPRRELLCGVSSCALLKELMLIHVFLSVENPENFECNDPPAPSLHKLHIQGGECAATISHWLAAGGVTPHHSLTFTVKDRLSAANLMGSSEALSNLVQKLEVRFMPDGSMSEALQGTDMSLATFTALHSCVLRFAFYEMCVPQNQSLPWIPTILAQLSSSHLRTLTISLAVDNVEDLRSLNSECAVRILTPAYFDDMRVLDWASIEDAILNDHLCELRKVIVEGRGRRSLLEEHIKDTCPKLHSQVILSLVAAREPVSWLSWEED